MNRPPFVSSTRFVAYTDKKRGEGKMRLSELFYRCLHIPYTHTENGADYATERFGKTLYVYLEGSNGLIDWKNNLDFPATPYRRMGSTVWFAHRGFLKVWKSVEPHLSPLILDTDINRISVVGFSHGAALAVLCHEYVWYHRPDLRQTLQGYGFGCPRVIWGARSEKLRERWENFVVVRNLDDLVTHLPPALLGYYHVGTLLEIGKRGQYSRIDAHRPENILAELQKREGSVAILTSKKATAFI